MKNVYKSSFRLRNTKTNNWRTNITRRSTMSKAVKRLKPGMLIVVIALLCVAPVMLAAQEFPTKPINLTVCIATGGTVDLSTRILASKAEKFLGQPVVITNNGGGAGVLAMDALAKAKPDGYTLVSCPQTAAAEIPHLRKTPYKLADFTPIMQFAEPEGGRAVR